MEATQVSRAAAQPELFSGSQVADALLDLASLADAMAHQMTAIEEGAASDPAATAQHAQRNARSVRAQLEALAVVLADCKLSPTLGHARAYLAALGDGMARAEGPGLQVG